VRPSSSSRGSSSAGIVARPSRAWIAGLAVGLASGCSVILGADRAYYDVGAGGSGGASATTSAASSSASAGGSSNGGGGASSASASTATASSSSAGTGGAVNDTCWHGEPADPGGTDPCGPSSVAVLADNFNDNLVGPLWGLYQISATAMEVNQRVEIAIPGAPGKFAGFVSVNAYSLLGCHGSLAILQSPQHPSTVTHLSFSPDPSSGADLVEVHQIGKLLKFAMTVGGVATDDCSIPYLPITHRYWRIREFGGDLLWETGSDGVAWIIQRREKAPAFVSSVRVDFGVIPIAADSAGVGIFDDFDLP
jgi:hypothetical protein